MYTSVGNKSNIINFIFLVFTKFGVNRYEKQEYLLKWTLKGKRNISGNNRKTLHSFHYCIANPFEYIKGDNKSEDNNDKFFASSVIHECNMLEEELTELNDLELSFRPFEIKTLKIKIARYWSVSQKRAIRHNPRSPKHIPLEIESGFRWNNPSTSMEVQDKREKNLMKNRGRRLCETSKNAEK